MEELVVVHPFSSVLHIFQVVLSKLLDLRVVLAEQREGCGREASWNAP